MNNPLYEISSRYLQALEMATDPDEEIDIGDTLEAIEGEWEEKAKAVSAYVLNSMASVEAMKAAEKRIYDRRKHAEAQMERLKKYLLDNMQDTGITKIECPYFKISLAKCPPSVEVVNEELIPEEYWRVKTIREVDKVSIKAAGGCPGARVVADKKRLSIR